MVVIDFFLCAVVSVATVLCLRKFSTFSQDKIVHRQHPFKTQFTEFLLCLVLFVNIKMVILLIKAQYKKIKMPYME